ncbi:MAG: Asp-tRNA(Asn)/Glu-tRNA(Gln) amidotransferase subunit GatC [Alphaproteobacteria bacterium]
MSNINADTVRRIAKLARIQVKDEQKLVPELSAILNLVNQLSQLNTENIPPMTTPAAGKTPLRPDVVQSDADSKTILQNAPQQQDNLFKVPQIIQNLDDN